MLVEVRAGYRSSSSDRLFQSTNQPPTYSAVQQYHTALMQDPDAHPMFLLIFNVNEATSANTLRIALKKQETAILITRNSRTHESVHGLSQGIARPFSDTETGAR